MHALCSVALLFCLLTGSPLAASEPGARETAESTAVADQRLALTLDELRTLTDVLGYVQRHYVEETSDQTLIENAIDGMLANLDPHTRYLTPEERKALEEDNSGRYGGVGIEVRWLKNGLTIESVTTDSPADKAGLANGDLIRRVNDEPVVRLTVSDVLKRVRGEIGSTVTMTVESPDDNTERVVTVERALIQVPSVYSRLYEGDIGYLRISEFQTGTAETASQTLDRLKSGTDLGLTGLVLDLRDNSGGVLNAAVGLADLFLHSGDIVITRSRGEDGETSDVRLSAAAEDEISGVPMVVLVDSVTASAAEIVAAALQDNRRALVMGSRTFGKGSVQTILPLRNGGAIKLTTARYYSPLGTPIQARGVIPDVWISESNQVVNESNRRADLRQESSLSGHLAAEDSPAGVNQQRSWIVLSGSDYPLYRALLLLNSMQRINQASSSQPVDRGGAQVSPPADSTILDEESS